MEVSFTQEIKSLRLGQGDTFHGEGILAITKGLLQSGVAYVGGYQGAPVSHLLDVMVQAKDYMDELGVHVEACSNEASAAAMLGASIHYPLRGAVTWKSIVGTNVAADALSNLSSPGVKGGVLIVVGEDYGEGASVIQERTHAYALKSTMCLLDPRPDLACMVEMVEQGFRLSEASNMPCILELRIRACHVRGSFECKDNVTSAFSTKNLIDEPAGFDYMSLAHPPVTFRHEKLKGDERLPAARRYVLENNLNELFEGKHADLGIVVQGGLYNTLIRALQQFGLADAFGETDIPILVLNVTYPLVPKQLNDFCVGKRAVLMVEEGQPEYIEQELATLLRRADIQTPLHGKDMLHQAGEYTTEVMAGGRVISPANTRQFDDVVAQAYANRIQRWSDGFYRTPKIHYDKTTLTGRPFYYFAYGAACTQVAIDTLTGESRVTKVDILHDVGRSINPAIDIGQIEGAFVQGMGWLTTEHLVWNDQGLLTTRAPSTYKIPTAGDVPKHFKVALWPDLNPEDNVYGSKAVGEPPFMLTLSEYEALRDAIAQARSSSAQAQSSSSQADADNQPVQLQAPATAEHVLNALNR